MNRIIFGFLIAMSLPATVQAQTGKHVAIGGSYNLLQYRDDRFRQNGSFSLLYRLSQTGHATDGWSLVPSASVGYTRTDFRPEVGGSEVQMGLLRSIPVVAGLGPQYRRGRTEVDFAVQAGASFNDFTLDGTGRTIYQDRLGADLEEIHTKTSFAARTGVGVWYDLNSRLGLYGGVAYLYNRPSARITASGVTATEKWDADFVDFSMGAAVGLF